MQAPRQLDEVQVATACGAVLHAPADYVTSDHIVAIVVILGVSLSGALLPVLAARVSLFRKLMPYVRLLNSLGVGVIIATSLVHMLPPGLQALNNPCLNLDYRGLAIVLLVLTMLSMQILETEMVVLLSSTEMATDLNESDLEGPILSPVPHSASPSCHPSLPFQDQPNPHDHHHHHHHQPGAIRDPLAKQLNVILFECSVAVHSIIIGVEMGVASGDTFHTLLTAISFHQFFEGIAVGSSSQGAFSQFKTSVFVALGFAITTPCGIFLGILISGSYAPTSAAALWVKGILHSVAAGILLYMGVVELLTYQFTVNADFHAKARRDRWAHYACILFGAGVMAAIGYWA
ncbi:hypothetical protein DYB38_003236 [Aphanomyces astaci]|uniref:Zinc/iron permease n=1 Tax=Aphanomyces astaci TaxID=112090 RepID=A0A397DHD4_APHAT|nr:hypothetical protein DYB38_003236 [Aphanomyces astaci]